jgi:hypothetical protein
MMNAISLKGIGAGTLAALILFIPVNILFGYYFLAVFGQFASGVDLANEAEVQKLVSRSLYNPPTIILGVIAIFITVGIPAYVAALIAGRAFIFHAMTTGGIVSLLCLTEWELVVQFPVLFVAVVGFTMAVAYVAGHLRQKQVLARAS